MSQFVLLAMYAQSEVGMDIQQISTGRAVAEVDIHFF